MLPQFLVIGGMKCGSTSLDYYLKGHPQLFLPEKELDFFSRRFSNGTDWYESLFEKCSNGQKPGETSVSYTKSPLEKGVPERIKAVLADSTKFIYVVRDPIDRIVSHYMHSIYAGAEERSLERIFTEEGYDNLYVQFSLYGMQLELYLRFFGRDQFMIISSDDLRAADTRGGVLRKIFCFLGVDDKFDSPHFSQVKYQSSKKGKKIKIAQLISTLPFYEAVKNAAPDFVRDTYTKLLTQKIAKVTVSEEFRQRLVERIKPDTDRFRTVTGMQFDSWQV